MKTINVILKVIVGAFLAFSVTACSKDKKSNNNGYYGYNNGQYIMQNGVCVSRINGQQVSPQLCYNQGGQYGMWQYMNGMCVNTQTGQQDPSMQACMNQGGGGMGYGQCVGMYRDQYGNQGYCQPSMGGGMPGMPGMPGMGGMGMGNNCTGWYLQNVQTGQWQQCM